MISRIPRSIALVTNRFAPSIGGIQTHVGWLAEELSRRGHDVTVLTHHEGSLPPMEQRPGHLVRRFPTLVHAEHFRLSPALGRHLAGGPTRYDLVHVHGYHDSVAAMAAFGWGGPLVFTPHFHGSSASLIREAMHVPYRRLGRKIVERADHIIHVTASERERFVEAFPAAASISSVISNGIDVSRFACTTPTVERDGRRLVLFAGRLEAYKNVDRLIDAMTHLDGHVLRIVGDGPRRLALQAQAETRGLGDAVIFEGRVSEERLAELMVSADVVVSMSTHEAQGISLLEALACGRPVVASAIPAHKDIADTFGIDLALVEPSEPTSSIAAAIAAATRSSIVPASVPTWAEVAERTAEIYEAVLENVATDRLLPM